MLIELAESIHAYYVRVGENRCASAVALLHIEHIYYKHDSIAVAVQKAHLFKKTYGKYSDLHPACIGKSITIPQKLKVDSFHPASFKGTPAVKPPKCDFQAKLGEMCNFVFTYGSERSKSNALLCAVYHNALHDRYHQARDMFLISHLQDTIDKADTKTQILYNRALVSLGLSAFRLGLIRKAHDCLSGICSGRVKELLAQGQSKSLDPEQEKLERRRQVPYHMHINPELLECCHLTSALLLELPIMAKGTQNVNISKHFRKYFNTYSNQLFNGPPENSRDCVLFAAKSLLNCEWSKACEILLGLEVWNLLSESGAEKVKTMLKTKIKEESVRIYLFTQGAHYETIALKHMCELFQMDEVSIRRIISKMISDKEISGAWDMVPEETLILYKTEPTSIQNLSSLISDKITLLVESNERLLDPLFGVYGYKDEWTGRDKTKQWLEQGRKPYGGYRGNQTQSQQFTRYPGSKGGLRTSGRNDRTVGGKNNWAPKSNAINSNRAQQSNPINSAPSSEISKKVGWTSM